MSPLLVAVLPIVLSPTGEPTASDVFKLVTDAAELRPTLRVVSLDQYFFHEGGELANRALACGSDTSCIASQLAPFQAELGVVVIANLEVSPPLLSVLLLDTTTKQTIGEETGDADRIEQAIVERTGALFDRAGHPRSGRLVVEVSPARAAIAIEGAKPDLGASNRFTLPPGGYTIVASADGFEEASARATVKSGEVTTVAIELEPKTSILESPWLWIAGGAVIIAAGATATAFALRDTRRCICVQTADGRDCSVCD